MGASRQRPFKWPLAYKPAKGNGFTSKRVSLYTSESKLPPKTPLFANWADPAVSAVWSSQNLLEDGRQCIFSGRVVSEYPRK